MDFAERAAQNEEIFRQINEQIEEGAEQHGVSSSLPFHCECGRSRCTETVELAPAVYERIAANPLHFVVKPSHQIPELERVIDTRAGYVVVEKVGEAREEIEREYRRKRHRT
jgi:hypothetical protein